MTRIAIIEKDKCHPTECGNYLCLRLCPINKTGTNCVIKGENKKANIDTKLCTGCGICPKRCPFGAIHIINLPEALNKPPIHRYGENGFHLYNLPTPLFGKVVGVLGRNGIGKSTAIKIIGGMIKPNLGKDKEAGYNEIIDYFKGQEAQVFFERLRDGKIRIAYKPQAIETIPKYNTGTVKALLEKVDEKNKLGEYAKLLQIGNILDSDIKTVSGGELQRIAICATALKKANVLLFDEPTSYLDVKQRINVSKFIRELVEKNPDTAVLVIEHDLIILDYMTELVHIFYGEVGAYGIVSHPKTTKEGINTYLAGYLKDENIRFRDSQIKFFVTPPQDIRRIAQLTKWAGIKKQLGRFSLKSDDGEMYKHEVCGMLGENGTGKTSFVKILAGETESEEGNVSPQVMVAYKPQYLDSQSEELVAIMLKEAISKYEVLLMRPLGLKDLMTKRLCELSGGELQRVAVAKCIATDADLYLLDEPSAYLDVEQRLIMAKAIRDAMEHKGTSCLVVDHDLLFIDSISNRLIVCEGKPAEYGDIKGPFAMDKGMNMFLKDLNLTFRRDNESNRPRANKPDSQIDRAQKQEGKFYYH